VPHVFVCAKSPVTVTLPMVTISVPVFDTVTDLIALVMFNTWLAKLRLDVDRLTKLLEGAVAAVCVPPPQADSTRHRVTTRTNKP